MTEGKLILVSARLGTFRNSQLPRRCPNRDAASTVPATFNAFGGRQPGGIMAKRTSIETEQQPSGKEIRIPADGTIKSFNSEFCDVKETVDDANGKLKDAADIAKKKHLNLSAFKVAQKLAGAFHNAKNQSIAAEKLAAWLANFDKLRKYFKLDEHANLQSRMFGEGEIGSEPARELDEDGEPDPRPTHLRQPGASAASNPVSDIAAKAGAKSSGVDPIDKVGRGPKLN